MNRLWGQAPAEVDGSSDEDEGEEQPPGGLH